MKKYRLVYKCSNGYESEVFVYAVNRMMAFEMLAEFGIKNIVSADCFLVTDEEE